MTYEEAGVSQLWLIDPKAMTIEVYGLEGNPYRALGAWSKGEVVVSALLPGSRVAVDDVFSLLA